MLSQHQNDPKMFLSYQIQDCRAQALELASGHKGAFSMPHVRGLLIFREKKNAYILTLEDRPIEYANCNVETYS